MNSKLEMLLLYEGYDSADAFLEDMGLDSVVPGICTNADCDYTTEVEPDASRAWCEVCETNSVASALALMGII